FFRSLLHFLTSFVCGKEPIVVVGKEGKLNLLCCAFLRSANLDVLFESSSVIAATRFFTSSLWIKVEVLRLFCAALLSSNLWFTSALSSWVAKVAKSLISISFC